MYHLVEKMDSVEIKKWGENKAEALDHLELALSRDWIDFERGAKVAGNKFYYLKGDLALLENAIYQFALNFVIEKGFKFMTVPHMVSSRILTGTGFAPRTSEQSDEYGIEGEDLSLIATAEIPLTGYHSDEIIAEDDLPLLYAGYSPCYRKEAGAYGKYARGLFRVHQFNKLELYAYTLPEKVMKCTNASWLLRKKFGNYSKFLIEWLILRLVIWVHQRLKSTILNTGLPLIKNIVN